MTKQLQELAEAELGRAHGDVFRATRAMVKRVKSDPLKRLVMAEVVRRLCVLELTEAYRRQMWADDEAAS
jgi:hypothetical protein